MKLSRSVPVIVTVFALGATAAVAQDPSEVIYDEDVVASYRLTMNAADWDKIVNDPFGQGDLYQPATMTWQGETVTQVGVKATGKASRQVGTPKPSIKIKFDEFIPDRLWKGVDMVRLDSLKLDFSALRDRLAYWAYRQAGANAPRSCHARLYVNGDFKGLYEVEEPIRKAFSRFRWSGGQPVDGNLYEVDYADANGNGHPQGTDQYLWRGGNPGTYVPNYFHPETNSVGGNYQDVVDLVNVLNSAPVNRGQLEALINMDRFLSYLAVTTATSNFDSIFSWGVLGSNTPNNHYWYHREDTNRMEIVAWDVENAFGNQYFTTNPHTGVGNGQYRTTQDIWFGFNSTLATSWIQGDGVAAGIVRSKIQQFMNGPLSAASARTDFIAGQIRSHIVADPYKPFTVSQFDAEVANVKAWLTRRINYLRSQFPNTVNNAAFASQSVPATMTAGQSYTVSVRMRNTGTTTWTSSNYALGSQNPTDNTTWGMNRAQLAAGDSIGQNQEKVFSWSVTAPAAAGTYDFQWQMRQSGIEWFGAMSPNVSVTVTTNQPPPPPPPTTNNAAFVSQSVPASMTAGQTYPVTVRMRNSGTSTWDDPAIFRLGSQNPTDNQTWGMNRVSMPAGSSIAPSQVVDFSWTVMAPAAAGTYNFQWQMRESGVDWFGALTTNVAVSVTVNQPPPPPPPPPTTNNAVFVSQTVPTSMLVGQSYPVTVRMRNTGTSTWNDPDVFRLGSQNPQDNLTWGMNRVSMPAGSVVAPGQEVVYSWNVTAPTTAGTYAFQWQMRQSGVDWFGGLSTNVPVTVGTAQPPPPPPPPPTTNNAAFVSQSVPAAMTVGQTYPVTIRMRNTGTTTWNDPDLFRLGSQNPTDNQTWGMNRVSMPAGSTIAPGQEVVYSWTVTAPASAGTSNFQWQMRQSGVEWFGPVTPNVAVTVGTTPPPPPPPPGSNLAQFVSQTAPSVLTTGETFTATVTMLNTGTTTWTEAGQYRLSSRAPRDNSTWGVNRVYLAPGDAIAPGQTHTFTFDVTAPAAAGSVVFQWSMVQDGVDWFDQMTPAVTVTVAAGTPPPVTPAVRTPGPEGASEKCFGSIPAGGWGSFNAYLAAGLALLATIGRRRERKSL